MLYIVGKKIMKKNCIFLFIFFISINLFSQSIDEKLKAVDKIMYSYLNIKSIEELSSRIHYDFKTDYERIRAVYTWIALNIKYEDNSNPDLLKPEDQIVFFNENYLQRIKTRRHKKLISDAFHKKKAICEGYALLFNTVCNQLNIKNELIYGYVKSGVNDIGYVPTRKNHIWNAVKIDDRWVLIDVTFGAGYLYKNIWQKHFNDTYFDTSIEKFRLTHFPEKEMWSNYLNQKSLEKFCYEPILSDPFFNHHIEIIKPKTGELKINDKEKSIHIKLKGLNRYSSVLYSFSHQNKVKIPFVSFKKKTANIYIRKPKKNTNLNIYIEKKLAMEYKVSVK